MFETERLRIRNFNKNDAERCFESWGKDNNLGRYILLYPMRNVSQMNELVSSFVQNENAWLFVPLPKKRKKCIGFMNKHKGIRIVRES